MTATLVFPPAGQPPFVSLDPPQCVAGRYRLRRGYRLTSLVADATTTRTEIPKDTR